MTGSGPSAIKRVVTAAALLVDTVNMSEPEWATPEQRDAFRLLEQQLRDVQALIQERRA